MPERPVATLAPPAADPPGPAIGTTHRRRLRDVWRSAGWPCQDVIEAELLAAGLLERREDAAGRLSVRVSDAGMQVLAQTAERNRAARSAHEDLVGQVATALARDGRIAWRGLALRARVSDDTGQPRWQMAMPDVYSVRHTSVAAYLQPVVHEIKVRRADLLGDLKKPAKRAAYLDLGGACWYVLGCDAKGRPIGEPDEIPAECGVMVLQGAQLAVARPAPRRPVERLPFAVWLELAKRTPHVTEGGDQAPLADLGDTPDGDPVPPTVQRGHPAQAPQAPESADGP